MGGQAGFAPHSPSLLLRRAWEQVHTGQRLEVQTDADLWLAPRWHLPYAQDAASIACKPTSQWQCFIDGLPRTTAPQLNKLQQTCVHLLSAAMLLWQVATPTGWHTHILAAAGQSCAGAGGRDVCQASRAAGEGGSLSGSQQLCGARLETTEL